MEDTCKGCGRKIIWAKAPSDDGKKIVKIPLDPAAPVYEIADRHPDYDHVRAKTAMVSHFITCPNASQFSGGNKKPYTPGKEEL